MISDQLISNLTQTVVANCLWIKITFETLRSCRESFYTVNVASIVKKFQFGEL